MNKYVPYWHQMTNSKQKSSNVNLGIRLVVTRDISKFRFGF